jgi:alpha-galactosidase
MNPMKRIIYTLLALSLSLPVQASSFPEVAQTPPMGWNSWNWFGKRSINENIVKEVIDVMVSSGLRDAGYDYVVVDGGWRDIKLGPNGELLPHPERFPGGMKALADYAHERGLKFGVHFVPGTHDCGGDPIGALGHEEVQMQQFVDWGLDFLKIDRCRNENGWTEDSTEEVYLKWHHLIANCGRDMVYSISAYVYRDWYPDICHMARTTYDIKARANRGSVFEDGNRDNKSFLSVMGVAAINNQYAEFAKPGYWNDPDMMVTGGQGLNPVEEQSHFALWCIMTSPLLLGNDPRHMTDAEKALLLNKEAIAINQDPTEQGRMIRTYGSTEIWAKKLQDNRYAVLLLNRDDSRSRPVTFNLEDLNLKGEWKARSVFAEEDLGLIVGKISLDTPPHGSHLLLLQGQAN